MCKCTPEIRTPWCGNPGCEMPEQIISPEHLRQQLDSAASEIAALLEKLESTKDAKRAIQEKLDAMAPLECEVCSRALWPEDPPHKHFAQYGQGRQVPFIAKKVPRK
jgi:hypothetical protein